MTISAIVPAAGCGARAALNGNKILAPLHDIVPWGEYSVLFWTLNALRAASYPGAELLEIIVVARKEEFEAIEKVWSECGFSLWHWTVEGGATRQDSVLAGVQKAQGDWVLVHDAARPCVSGDVISRTVEAAQKTGGAIAALPVSDTVKRASGENFIEETLNRNEIWLAQTPQVFRRDLFLAALQSARIEGFEGTDCASIMERAGHKVALAEGNINNLKVTYAADLERAAAILKAGLGGYYSIFPSHNPHRKS
ncbi:MAG: 2-C-methyl-D-erythritol 4-phosphate cytidylyltransferase [Armatimonadetes bacterium]|nr:2-C-methyl-D-erythritol 4-phosphate cytidylyltransferase [Armatimonadota bacterium]